MKKIAIVACGILASLGFSSVPARAGGHFGIGIGIGVPGPYYYSRPYYDYDYYYRPYPVYVAPTPVFVSPPPVIQAAPAGSASYQASSPPSVIAQSPVPSDYQAQVEHCLQQLTAADEQVRADSVLQLGRLKAQAAIDPVAAALSGDRSPMVREAAARALGLIGSPQALPALQHAAQADSDRDVRRSAQFAADVVMSNRGQ